MKYIFGRPIIAFDIRLGTVDVMGKLMPFVFGEINVVLGSKKGQQGFSDEQKVAHKFG